MSDDELVTVAVAESEGEAAMICGYLDSQGIDATYDKSGIAQPFAITGPRRRPRRPAGDPRAGLRRRGGAGRARRAP